MESMKKATWLLALLIPFTACKEKSAGASGSAAADGQGAAYTVPEKAPVAGELVLIARLAEIPGSFPANDLYNYAYVMKYQVVKVVQGTYADADILVGHYNPRIARNEIKDEQDAKVGGDVTSFQVGDVHYLVLSQLDGIWTGAVEDDYFKEKRPRYWASWADKAKR
jgi:hypothetical protein